MFIVFPRIRLRVSLLALPCLLLMLWLEGGGAFAIMLCSALLHELGHLCALRRLKYRVRRVDVLPMGALIVLPEGISNRDEVIIALSGPIASLLCACVCGVVFAVCRDAFALLGVLINTVLALFNLLPVRKLDGGKALYCFLLYKNKKAERICSAASATSKAVFVLFALLCFLLSDMNLGVALLSLSLLLQL